MDMQAWWDELFEQFSSPNPNRDTVIKCLKELLEGIEDGDDLPKEGVEA